MPEKVESSRLWLVRHAQSAAQTGEELSVDSNLSALGRKQASRLVDPIGRIRFDAAFISPLKRARQTFEASGASVKPGAFMEFDTRIVEVMQKGGYLPLLPYGDLPDYALSDRHDAWDIDVLDRVRPFVKDMEELSQEHSDILVVSHAMVLNMIFHIFVWGATEGDPETYKNCRPGNASVSILERTPGSATYNTLRLWNYQEHLIGLPGDWSLPKA